MHRARRQGHHVAGFRLERVHDAVNAIFGDCGRELGARNSGFQTTHDLSAGRGVQHDPAFALAQIAENFRAVVVGMNLHGKRVAGIDEFHKQWKAAGVRKVAENFTREFGEHRMQRAA